VRSGAVRPSEILTQVGDLTGAVDAYDAFDERARRLAQGRPGSRQRVI
jgi:hypothetical protein